MTLIAVARCSKCQFAPEVQLFWAIGGQIGGLKHGILTGGLAQPNKIVCSFKNANACRIMFNCRNNGLEMVVAGVPIMVCGVYQAVAPFSNYLFLRQQLATLWYVYAHLQKMYGVPCTALCYYIKSCPTRLYHFRCKSFEERDMVHHMMYATLQCT